MAYIINSILITPSKAIDTKVLSCLPKKAEQICKKSIYDKRAVEGYLEKAAKVKQELENSRFDDIIKESVAAKAFYGLK